MKWPAVVHCLSFRWTQRGGAEKTAASAVMKDNTRIWGVCWLCVAHFSVLQPL